MKIKFCVLTVVIVSVLLFQSCAPVSLFPEEVTQTPSKSVISPTPSVPTPTKAPVEKNIARAKPVTASKTINSGPASKAFDNTFNTSWSAGDFAPQWIEVDLRAYYTITKITLTVAQSPDGDTVHRILGRGVDGKYHLLHTFDQFTQDGMQLQIIPEEPWQNVSSIRIETISSPSWVGWREVMIFSKEDPTSLDAALLPTPGPAGLQGVITFYSNQTMGGIYLTDADGSGNTVLLSAHPTNDSKPCWSPDGSRIAFESLRDDPIDKKLMDIYVMNADGNHLTRLTNTDGYYTEPDWSPDGKQIVVAGQRSGDSSQNLFLLTLETGEVTRLTNTEYVEGDPVWSPDGSQIAFTSNRQGQNVWNIYILDVESGDIRQLTEGGGSDFQPDWSPDGERLLFVSNRSGDYDIYLTDAAGGNLERLTDSTGQDADPEWSPDGSAFIYTHGNAKQGDLYMMDTDGSNRRLFYTVKGKYSGYPAWSSKAVISAEPMIGPPFCMLDTNRDGQPDQATDTFTTEDGYPFVIFPYRNMTTSQVVSIYWDFELIDQDLMTMIFSWKYGANGWFWSYDNKTDLSTLEPQHLKIQLSLGGELMQEVNCDVIAP